MIAHTGGPGSWIAVAAVGTVGLAVSSAAARRPAISPTEQRVFRAVNRLPDGLYPVLWLPMQLGNLVVGTAVGLLVALLVGDVGVAVGVVVAMVLKLVTERVIRHEMSRYLAIRRRPGTSQPGAILRGDVPVDGPSFPSGHVLLVAAIACVVATELGLGLVMVAFALTAVVAVGRVYVAAHNPLDVLAGLGAGLLVGGVIATVLTW
ncbi:MAG TPA: phosphatase PAP2 family protein [Ilumatobacteraceae bacterium]|nr:phosphatase PAP2 family protein [Ilumatobacteraceae bacterium]